ncbi:MAG: RluA family pseudouridine synthase [Candidatus Woykebacteria bacterium]
MQQFTVRVKPKEARVDKYLARVSKSLSRSQAKKLIKKNLVWVNERKIDPDYEIRKGDKIKFEIPLPTPSEIIPQNIPLDVVYEDEDVLVIDKEAGMVVHPTVGHPKDTLVNALLFYLKNSLGESEKSFRPGIVHRLDKGTSGLMVLAKNEVALANLKKQFKDRKVGKKYLALVAGKVEPSIGIIKKPIGRHPVKRQKFTVAQQGREALTTYKVLENIGNKFSLVEVEPKTGRTHQIRVHLSSIGYPIVGDKLYGGKPAPRIFLHAAFLEFSHPKHKKKLKFESELPIKLKEMLDKTQFGKIKK